MRKRKPKKQTNKSALVTKKQVQDMLKSNAVKTLPKLWTTVIKYGSLTSAFEGPIATTHPTYGTGAYYRVSDSIRVRHIDHRFVLYGGDNQNVIRLIAIQMKGPTNIDVNNLFFNGPTGSRDVLSFINPYSDKSYHLLFDKTFALNLSSSNGTIVKQFRIIPKIKTINYLSGGTVPTAGQIIYFMVSDSDVVPSPVVEWNSMMEFDDDL